MQDWRGTEIEVGDTVVYPTRFSSSMSMQEGVVTGFGVVESEREWKSDPTPTVNLEWKRSNSEWETRSRLVKNVKITETSRLTVIRKSGREIPDGD